MPNHFVYEFINNNLFGSIQIRCLFYKRFCVPVDTVSFNSSKIKNLEVSVKSTMWTAFDGYYHASIIPFNIPTWVCQATGQTVSHTNKFWRRFVMQISQGWALNRFPGIQLGDYCVKQTWVPCGHNMTYWVKSFTMSEILSFDRHAVIQELNVNIKYKNNFFLALHLLITM